MSASAAWSQTGYGHLTPATERNELRNEIDGMMAQVSKLNADKEMRAEERVEQIEQLKQEIWKRKARIVQIKREQRGDPMPAIVAKAPKNEAETTTRCDSPERKSADKNPEELKKGSAVPSLSESQRTPGKATKKPQGSGTKKHAGPGFR